MDIQVYDKYNCHNGIPEDTLVTLKGQDKYISCLRKKIGKKKAKILNLHFLFGKMQQALDLKALHSKVKMQISALKNTPQKIVKP